MKFCISVLCLNNLALTKRCIESVLLHSSDRGGMLIVTDNGSTDGTREYLAKLETTERLQIVVVTKKTNEGFVAPNRYAFALADSMRAEFFVLLNNDITVVSGWLEKLMEPFASFPNAALTGPENACCHLLANFHGTAGPFEYLEGSCLMMRSEIIRRHGLFPVELSGAYGEDSCLSLRMRELGYTLHRVKLPMPHVRGATSSMVPQAKQWQEANHQWLKRRFAHYLKVRYFEHPILIKRADAWGDVLLVTPIIRAIKKHRPLSPIWVETNCTDVFRDNPHVAKCARSIPVTPDCLVIDLNSSYERMLDTGIVDAYTKTTLSVLVGDFAVEDKSLDFYCRQSDAPKRLYAPGAKVVAVHTGPTNWKSKDFGAEKFNVLTKALISGDWTVILVGGRSAPISCTTDLRGLTTVHQLAAVIGASNFFVGLDSLPLHLAQAMGTPAVGIFGICWSKHILTSPTAVGVDSPALSAGLRHRVTDRREVDDGGEAIKAITSEMVLEAFHNLAASESRNLADAIPL